MRSLHISIGLLLLLFTNTITSQKINTSDDITNLDVVIITAQFEPQSEKNIIYKVKSINAKTIDNKSANNLRELLQQELNIELNQNSVFGTNIELQGISKENIKILVDGVPVIGRLNGIIDLNQINLNNIDRVEVIEGPVSVYYGTDAMGGVINLISKKEQKKTFEGSIAALYEDIDAVNINGTFGYKFGKNTVRVNGGSYSFNGLSTNADAIRNLNWEERKQAFGNVTYIRQLNKLKLRYSGNLSNEKLYSLGDLDRRGNITDKNYYTKRLDNSITLQGKVLKNKFLNVTASYQDYQRYHDTFSIDPTTFESTPSTRDTRDDNIVKFNYGGLKAQLGKSKYADKLNYAVGTDINIETTEGSRILDKKQEIQTTAVFGSINYKISDKIEIQPAIRHTWNSTYGALLSPAFNSKLKFDNQNILRFSYAQGFRAPSLKELFLDFHISAGPTTYTISGNENLDVEKSHSFNLQYSFNKQFYNKTSFSVEPSLFYNDISNLIALSQMVNNERNYINIDKFKSLGGKIDFAYNPKRNLSIKAGISIIGRYNKYTENSNTQEFLYSPEITSNIGYKLQKSNIGFNIYYKFTGKKEVFEVERVTNNLIKTTRDSFSNLNTSVLKTFFKQSLSTSFGVKNLFDVKDIETVNEIGTAHSRDMQLWGRSFYLKTIFDF